MRLLSAIVALLAPTLDLHAAADESLPPAPSKPNLLFIFADDIGYEAVGAYGGLDFATPNLDRMAKDGQRFSRAYASPVCTPSRVSLHTGLYTSRHGFTKVLPVHRGTKDKVDFVAMPTFSQLLRSHGYLTSTTGKWQLATLEVWPGHIRESGFDSWCVWQIWKDGEKTYRHWNPTFNHDGKIRDDISEQFGPDVLTDYVIGQMQEAQNRKKPFLIVHNELLPHDPIVETPTEHATGQPASLGNMISYMDKLVGRLLDEVESLGIRENTYVFFMGDNGTHEEDFENPNAGEPGELPHTRHTTAGRVNGGKFKIGDAGTHVPLIVWGPKSIPAGSVCDDLVDIVDLFPTFCDLSDIELPRDLSIDGRSIAPQIRGKSGIPREWVHHAIFKQGESLFDGSWRYIAEKDALWDARQLPEEAPATRGNKDAEAARTHLREILRKITPDGPRPPIPFPQ